MTKKSAVNLSANEDAPQKQARYEAIAAILREEIIADHKPGDFLETESSFAERFGVNRHTIRRAIDELVSEDLVWRQQGRGTLVLQPPMDYQIHSQTRFTETVTSLGHQARSIVIGRRMTAASEGVARWLKIEPLSRVVQLDALRLVNDQPVLLTTHFFAADPYEPLYLEYDGGSLHGALREKFGVELKRMESLITARLPMDEDAMALRLSPKQPILRVKSLNVEVSSGQPVEYVISRFRADSVQLKVEP
ncbi:phosphonate metabolism transcriptional regulator PhnF [Algisphaera agarilytica]|uniref:GntR family phosphonate transport system transcriptional regulator n=1 Tax=Algisphaera agarilytica TaxID=1385975 RepID=A0A7X0H917_9BACT|nr:phosphonate metabolism transcriptional regulator PhnF [Algisphaera agarilytica]MBB6431368.1 GntR family phosphonate transport system transcriptional regulator [Algisphaera agarilytica]